MNPVSNHLAVLEAETIHIIREMAPQHVRDTTAPRS